jgi:FAD binding domain
VLEVLQDFPSARPPLEWLLQTVPRLRPRLFSISSALTAFPAQAHITAAIVDWVTPFKRRRQVRLMVAMLRDTALVCHGQAASCPALGTTHKHFT